ncbi:hypothetical protein BGM21_15705 [Geobacillus thermoleovorans]|nr:hypothetical protein BGM21_15705 [Geobacillus thermoleovorans]
MGDLSFRMLGDTFILLEIRQQGLFLCLSEFYLAPRVYKNSENINKRVRFANTSNGILSSDIVR